MKKLKITIFIILAILILAGVVAIANRNIVNQFTKERTRAEEVKKGITYKIIYYTGGKLGLLIKAEDSENGIEIIKYKNENNEDTILNTNGKNEVTFDYTIIKDGDYNFSYETTTGEIVQKVISINDEFRKNIVEFIFQQETEIQTALTLSYNKEDLYKDVTNKSYKIGKNATIWQEYKNDLRLDEYQLRENNAINPDGTITIAVRLSLSDGNIVEYERNITLNTKDIQGYREEEIEISGDSILKCIEDNAVETGNYVLNVNGKKYATEVYNYKQDATYIANFEDVYINDVKCNGLGNSSPDKKMLIVKYNGNLTVNENSNVIANTTKETINGSTNLCCKKGMFVYCAGTVENKGKITMTARGTVNQEGEDVFLWKNTDGTYEYVPALGGTGGAAVKCYANKGTVPGNSGNSGETRGTGGGGSGAARHWIDASAWSGAGAKGTSYSGGAGGGANDVRWRNVRSSGAGAENGGAGGYAVASYSSGHGATGGAGNPGGVVYLYNSASGKKGADGTGGLLIVYANNIKNSNEISANGVATTINGYSTGGSSGGGSLNIFVKNLLENEGEITAKGGTAGNGGAGGEGTVTIGSIATGIFVQKQ